MSEPCHARRGTPEDVELIAELVRSCRQELVAQRGGPMWAITGARVEPVEPLISSELNDPTVLTVVGEYVGVGVGFAVGVLLTASDGRPYVRVTDLFTMPEARHVGVGEAMMDLCIEWARQNRAVAVDAAVLPGTRDAKNFFEGFGLTARMLTVSLDL